MDIFKQNVITWMAPGHDAENTGDNNKINQKGRLHKSIQRGNSNKTGQEGERHNNEVEGHGNTTVQLKASNTSKTYGDNNKTGQNGRVLPMEGAIQKFSSAMMTRPSTANDAMAVDIRKERV
ncbi:hypothetical protein F4821DRAFT_724 [Hypoxylon rubiginosum]|uniref:Uncharacterized protein n=1 Tax=Hypoxylon rubiginosum TaxID=110542 RepID=A0ACC0DM68_9PEZI|nr:hypothetical protein F4821DRAFT_724 [Hypoxylon rubiginosum]